MVWPGCSLIHAASLQDDRHRAAAVFAEETYREVVGNKMLSYVRNHPWINSTGWQGQALQIRMYGNVIYHFCLDFIRFWYRGRLGILCRRCERWRRKRCKGEFEPELVKKQQTTLIGDIEEKILSTYTKGMTTRDIEGHIKEIYGLDVSDSAISRITDKILPVVKEWQARPLQELYAVVYMDAIHFHVRAEGQIVKKAV